MGGTAADLPSPMEGEDRYGKPTDHIPDHDLHHHQILFSYHYPLAFLPTWVIDIDLIDMVSSTSKRY